MFDSQAIAAGAARSVFSYDAQHDRLIRLVFPRDDGPDRILLPNRLRVHEEVSRCFRVEAELLSDDAQIPLKSMMGRMVTISLVREDGSLRYFNGYVTEFRFIRADGGFAFYQMALEPWLAFARLRKDNVSFHGKSVIELTELTFAHYRQADWRTHIVDELPRMTCANQYDETDYNHLHRRWEAHGLAYHYEHREDGHTLWLYDKSYLVQPIDPTGIDDSGVIPFRDKAGSLEEDGIREWTAVRRLGSGRVTLASFDYKNPVVQRSSAQSLNEQGDVYPYEIYENTGSYGFRTRDDGEKLAYRRMGERDANTQTFDARGNDRTVQPGRFFKLGGHFSAALRAPRRGEPAKASIRDRHYLILSVDHEASNNYQAGPGAPSHYENTLRCVRKDIQWRPGRHYNSQPCTYPGIQTAIVVGPEGAEIHTDGYGRVKIQFHWDRQGKYDENSSPWLRVMSPGAGREFGNIRLPRVGEEVAVVFLDGNIDHPVILGGLHNYTHMPPWQLPEQRALSGLRSRELAADGGSRRGNHLVLDDTPGKIQAQLKSDHQCSQLSLGHITRIEDTGGRKDARGEGWELRTDGHGVARAAQGMLITTEARPNAASHIKDMGETCHRLTAAAEQHRLLGDVALKNGAQETGDNQVDVAIVLQAQGKEIEGAPSGKGGFPELAQPHLVLVSPAGIASTTAQSTHIASDLNTAITSGKSVSIAAGDGFFASIRQAFRLFVQKAGMKLIAASGDIDVKALSDNVNVLAKLNITHTANRIVISAKEDIVINGGGSYAKFSAGGIECGTTGTFTAHAASHHLDPAKNMAAPDLKSNVVDVSVKRDLHLEYVDADNNPLQHDPIQAHAWDGHQHDSTLDAAGKTILSNVSRGSFRAEQIKRK
jgi:type VI secretion system secreted protein VgrG